MEKERSLLLKFLISNGCSKDEISERLLDSIVKYISTKNKDVRNQRELLIDYTEKLNNGDFNHLFKDSLKVDTFLSNL